MTYNFREHEEEKLEGLRKQRRLIDLSIAGIEDNLAHPYVSHVDYEEVRREAEASNKRLDEMVRKSIEREKQE